MPDPPPPQTPRPPLWERLRRWIVTGSFDTIRREANAGRSIGRNILLAGAVGVVAGAGAVLFHMLTGLVGTLALELAAGYDPGAPAGESGFFDRQWFTHEARALVPWMLVVVPTLGGLLSGWLVYTFAPEAEGHGTDAVIEAYHMKRGEIRSRVPIIKMVASAITLGTGGSGGREGPIAQIGAGFGSYLGAKLKLSVSERRLLTVAGLGAGIAAIFHAPLAGAIFAIEVLYRDPDFEAEALIPSFIACTVAYCVFSLILSLTLGLNAFHPLFIVAADIRFEDPSLLMPLAMLAGVMALASWGYVRCFYGTNRLFHRLPIAPVLKPAIGAMLTGVVALICFYSLRHFLAGGAPTDATAAQFNPAVDGLGVLASGYGFLQKVLSLQAIEAAQMSGLIALLLAVGLGKIITTSLTIGSGGSGGVFGPSMVIGGSLGAVVGIVFHRLMPDVVGQEDIVVFGILGMASFFAASANTPVSTLIMVSELTGSYALLMPAMWVCALAYLVSRRWTIYSEQVKNRLESPAHRGDFIIDILEGMTIRDAITEHNRHFVTVPIDMPLRDVVRMLTDNRQAAFPVLDHAMRYHGMFSLNDVRRFLYDSDIGDIAVAHDLATEVQPLLMTTELGEAMARFSQSAYEELPVANTEDTGEIVAMLSRVDVIAAYNKQLLETRTARQQGE